MIFSAVWTVSRGIFLTFFQYLFLKEMLGTKVRYAYLWFYLGTWLYGHINVWFGVAGTVWGNLIYLCVCAFALNSLLFHGSGIKRCFFTLWIYGVQEVACGIYLPLFQIIAARKGCGGSYGSVPDAVDMAACLTAVFMMEILKRKLCLLKRDFEDRDGLYLICMIVFICVAVGMMPVAAIGMADWDVRLMVFPSVLVAVMGEILYVCCIVMLERRLVERLAKQQYRMLEQHLAVTKEQYSQYIKIRHDMKNHSLCLSQLLANGNIEEAKRYLEQWNAAWPDDGSVQTGSVFSDALLNPKYRQAEELGIDISVQVRVPEEDRIAPVDLCCLLANALDNAIEACKRDAAAGYPAGWIRMKAKLFPHQWVFEISNSTYLSVRQQEGRFPSSKRVPMSGVGLQNIRAVVDRYEGVLEIKTGSSFTLNAMFPLP